MRVISLAVRGTAGDRWINGVGRADVVSDPLLGCKVERVMSSSRSTEDPHHRPFIGWHLSGAVWKPVAPDMLVAACADTPTMIPRDLTHDLPWIVALTAWRTLMPTAPSRLLERCWNRGLDPEPDTSAPNPLEAEVLLVTKLLLTLLQLAPPEELVAESGRLP